MAETQELLRRICTREQVLSSVMVIAAHPDDETIGLGAQLPQLRRATFVCVTNGAPRWPGGAASSDYAAARRAELQRTLELAGVDPERLWQMGFVDQEAALSLEELTHELVHLFRALAPELVITHAYEGGHPDHDATAFSVHAACRIVGDNFGLEPPRVAEMAAYHSGPRGMTCGEFLPVSGCPEIVSYLTDEQRQFKRSLFDCFASQQNMLRQFPLDAERFRPAPPYRFTRPPHAGPLFYENYEWGMTWPYWRYLANVALTNLRLNREEALLHAWA